MEVKTVFGKNPVAAAQESQLGVAATDATARANDLKPLLDGDLKVTVAERNVLDDLQRIEDAEEPSRADTLGELVREAFNFDPPEMPNFV